MNRHTRTTGRTALDLPLLTLLALLLVACPATPINHAPEAHDQTITTNEDTAVVITLDVTDEDDDPLTCTITCDPSHGTLTGTPPDMTYAPDADYAGTDSFAYTGSDGALASNEATVTITIIASNDAPVAIDKTVSTAEDTPIAIPLTATDPDGDDLSYEVVKQPSHGVLSGMPPDVMYTPDAGFSGLDMVTFTASDGTLTSAPATVTIDVGGTNDPPTGLTLDQTSIPENAGPPTDVGTLTTNDPDPGDTHTYTLTPGPGDDDNHDFAIADATLQTARAFDHETTPTKTIRIRTTDPLGASYEAAFTITIEDVNESPTGITLTPDVVPEGQPAGTLVGTLTTDDPDEGDTHTYTLTTGDGDDNNHLFTLTGNELRSAEPFDHEATPILTVRIFSEDQGALGIARAITITVEDANNAPVITPPSDQELIQNFVSPRSLHLTFGATDEDGDDLTITATSDNHDVVTDAGLHILCDAGECELGFTCARTNAQTATITLEASDGTDTTTATFQVRIAPRLVTNTHDDGPDSLRQVVDDAVTGDVITFDTQGMFATPQTIVLTTGQIRIETPMLIQGPGQGMLTISAGDASRVFRVGTDNSLRFHHQAIIRDVTVSSGNGRPQEVSEPSAYGGAIQIADRTLVERVSIRNSSADEGGGVGIYIKFPLARDPLGTLVELRDCLVESSTALYGGGGIYVRLDGRAQASVLIQDCVIRRNRAHDNYPDSTYGGGIQGGRLEIVDTTIEENFGHGLSGAGEIQGSTIRGNEGSGIYGSGTMIDTVVEGNNSRGPGGGLHAYGEFTVDSSTIAGNTASTGAGIYINSGSLTLTNGAIVRGNTTKLVGGGAHVDGGTLRVEDATISGNTAGTGGGIHIGMGTVVLEPATSITQNTALTDGGGIYNRDGTLEGAVAGGNVHDNDPNDIAP